MSKGKDRTISQRSDGQWANKRDRADRASSLHSTQQGAVRAAKEMMNRRGQGGELKIKGEDGVIRSKDTINRRDPNPPRDREH